MQRIAKGDRGLLQLLTSLANSGACLRSRSWARGLFKVNFLPAKGLGFQTLLSVHENEDFRQGFKGVCCFSYHDRKGIEVSGFTMVQASVFSAQGVRVESAEVK